MSAVVRLHELTDTPAGGRSPLWWGLLLLITIESMVFGSLFASYVYLRLGQPVWPPAGIEPPDLLLPLINTGVLAASSGAVFYAMGGLKKGDMTRLRRWLAGGVALEIVFLAIKLIESSDFGAGWNTHAYWSIHWSINGLHTIHVIVAIIMGAAALVLAWKGHYTRERRVGMQAVSLYWQFVAAVWLPLLIVLYFVPRWF